MVLKAYRWIAVIPWRRRRILFLITRNCFPEEAAFALRYGIKTNKTTGKVLLTDRQYNQWQFNMDVTQILGLAAGALTTFSLLPQVIKIYKSRSAKDLSVKTFLLLWSGTLLWAIYGTIEKDIPVMVTNVLTLILASALLFFKFRYRNQWLGKQCC